MPGIQNFHLNNYGARNILHRIGECKSLDRNPFVGFKSGDLFDRVFSMNKPTAFRKSSCLFVFTYMGIS